MPLLRSILAVNGVVSGCAEQMQHEDIIHGHERKSQRLYWYRYCVAYLVMQVLFLVWSKLSMRLDDLAPGLGDDAVIRDAGRSIAQG